MAMRRLQRELQQLAMNPVPGISAAPETDGDLYKWNAMVTGPEGTPYEGGVFMLKITIPTDYPFKPPKVKYATKIYHPNVSAAGDICIDSLTRGWSPALTISHVLLGIVSLMDDPNPADPLRREVAQVMLDDPERYRAVAREYVVKYAQ